MRTMAMAAGVAALLVVSGAGPVTAEPPALAHQFQEPVNKCWTTDNTNPGLNQLSFSATTLDVRTQAKTLTVRALISDNAGPGPASGILGATVTLTAMSTGESTSIRLDRAKKMFHWVGRLVFPRGSVGGAWRVANVTVSDRASNVVNYSYDDLAPATFDRDLTVDSVPDTTAPTVSALRIDPHQVDARNRGRVVTFTAEAQDTGGAGLGSITVVVGDDGSNTVGVILTRVPGKPGRMRGTLPVVTWSGTHRWKVSSVIAVDKVGNTTTYDSGLAALGFDRTFRARSRDDLKDPKVSGARLSTHRVDIRKQAATVKVRLAARDADSGVGFAFVTVDTTGSLFGRTVELRRGAAGVFTGKIRMTPCNTPAGPARVSADITDAAGNTTSVQLGKIAVRAKDHTLPTAAVADSTSVPPAMVTVDFDKPVNGISTSSAVIHPVSSLVTVAGDWSCLDAASSPVSCASGAVSHATFAPIVALTGGAFYTLVLNPEGILDLTDLHGNPFHRNQLTFRVQ